VPSRSLRGSNESRRAWLAAKNIADHPGAEYSIRERTMAWAACLARAVHVTRRAYGYTTRAAWQRAWSAAVVNLFTMTSSMRRLVTHVRCPGAAAAAASDYDMPRRRFRSSCRRLVGGCLLSPTSAGAQSSPDTCACYCRHHQIRVIGEHEDSINRVYLVQVVMSAAICQSRNEPMSGLVTWSGRGD